MTQQASLLDQILAGQNRQLQLMAASGLVPLPPEELLPLQVALAYSPDGEIAGRASQALSQVEPRRAVEFLAERAGARELAYFARSQHPQVLEAIIRRRDVPRHLLVELAARLPPDLQEPLVLRHDAILDEPKILEALERNPQLGSYAKRRIGEYREHLLPQKKPLAKRTAETTVEDTVDADALTEEEIREAVDEAKKKPAEGQVDDLSGLSDGQIRGLPVPIRVRLARSASRQLRSVLIRDTNSQVALSVLRGPTLSDQEVEQIASSRSVVEDVLVEIARRREWVRKYSIARALVRNPRTQLAVALRLLPRMSLQDLRHLAKDKNVAEGVRSTALRMYQAKR